MLSGGLMEVRKKMQMGDFWLDGLIFVMGFQVWVQECGLSMIQKTRSLKWSNSPFP